MAEHGDEGHVITISSTQSEGADLVAPKDKGKDKAARHTDTIVIKDDSDDDADDTSHDVCLICLRSDIQDRSVLPTCLHSLFCFECILQWSEIKRTCPLCKRPIGDYILHNVQSDSDYSRHFLRPESGAQGHDAAIAAAAEGSIDAERQRAQVRRRLRGRYALEQASGGAGTSRYLPIRPREGERSGWTEWARSSSSAASEEATEAAFAELDRAIERRRLVYRRRLYAKHVGSNRHSGFRPPPTPNDFTTQPHHLQRLTPFLRRELYSLPLPPDSLDVEFLMTYITSILKTMDIKSEAAVRLLMDFFASRELAEHFTHEVMTFCRSPARDCRGFDRRVEYDWPWKGGSRAGRNREGDGNSQHEEQQHGPDGGSAPTTAAPAAAEEQPPSLLSRLGPHTLLGRISASGDFGGGDGDAP